MSLTPEEKAAVERVTLHLNDDREYPPNAGEIWSSVPSTDLRLLLAALSRFTSPDVVDFYEREFYPLSNFSAFKMRWAGLWFDTSEAAYHWEKFPDVSQLRVKLRLSLSAHEAFKIAESHKSLRRPDWDDVKVGVMAKIIRAKADQHEYVRRKLMETGDRLLIEGSWRDDYWGVGPRGDGQNMLGKLWMAERERRRLANAEGEG